MIRPTSCSDGSNEKDKKRCKKLEDFVRKQRLQIIEMRKKMKIMKNTIYTLKNKHSNDKYKIALQSVFTDCQIKALFSKQRCVRTWSHDTIKRALQLKFVCGTNGYNELIRQGYPLPNARTLQRRIEDFKFQPGISEQMLEFLKMKKPYFKNDSDVECGLIFDEMSITSKRSYNPSTGSLIGSITFPNDTGDATHAIVFMLVGVCYRWKHVVGYHFTGNKFDSRVLKEIIFQIINKTEEIEYHVNFITSDMGSGNIGLWRLLGISTGMSGEIVNRIVHPFDVNRYLYIIADPPHVFKNLKQALINNEIITISEDIVIKYNLPTNKVKLKHFNELISIQDNCELLLTPKLSTSDICTNNFNKMKVNKARNVFSNDVSSSFELLADENKSPEYVTTAWFVKIVSRWFILMTSRCCSVALGKKNENTYNNSIKFLYEIINIFTRLKIGNQFKPVQRGIIISTKSIIELTATLITEKNFKFVLTSRFTQDSIENLFGQIRQKHVIPTPLQFSNDLKLISVAMYMRRINNRSYDDDNREYLSGFVEHLSEIKQKKKCKINLSNTSNSDEIPCFNKNSISMLSTIELNSLYNIAGYIINSISKTCKICNKCLKSVGSKTALPYSFTKFVQLKCYTKNSLFFVNVETFKIFIKFEHLFRYYSKYFNKMQNVSQKLFLISKCNEIKANHIFDCHSLHEKIITRFIVFRLKIFNKKNVAKSKKFDSKSMAMHNNL